MFTMKEKFLIYKDGPEKFDNHNVESVGNVEKQKENIIRKTQQSLNSLQSDLSSESISMDEIGIKSPEIKIMSIRLEELKRKKNRSENLSKNEQIELQALAKYAEFGDSRLVELYQLMLKKEQTKNESIEYTVRVNNWDKSEEEKLEMIDKAISDNS